MRAPVKTVLMLLPVLRKPEASLASQLLGLADSGVALTGTVAAGKSAAWAAAADETAVGATASEGLFFFLKKRNMGWFLEWAIL